MNAQVETIPQAVGDWTLRGGGPDAAFASASPTDAAVTTETWRRPVIHGFPGLQLYRRIVASEVIYDRELNAWARGLALALARSHTRNGQPYVRGELGEWLDDAGQDALHYAIHKRWPHSAEDRAVEHGITRPTYQRVRDPVAGGIMSGFDNFRASLLGNYRQVMLEDERLMESFYALRLR